MKRMFLAKRIFESKRDGLLVFSAVALGCTSIVTQTILLREFLSVFFGNELVLGILLACWMLMTGAGAFAGRSLFRRSDLTNVVLTGQVLLALLPLATVLALNSLWNVVFPLGAQIGIVESTYVAAVLVLPYGLVSGALFTILVRVFSAAEGGNRTTTVYVLESAGSIAGGAIFNVVLISLLSTFEALVVIALVNLLACLALAVRRRNVVARYAAGLLTGLLVLLLLSVDLVGLAREKLFAGQQILYHRDTPYGSLTVTRQGDQTNFFEDSALLFSTNDPTSNEETVHYAMVQHPHPRNVLLISGGISGTPAEILKYNVERIDYCEINPWIVQAGRQFTAALQDPRVHVVTEDPRRYVRTLRSAYDAVLINVPDPGTAQINRLYTTEFFADLKRAMTDRGILSVPLLSFSDYMSDEGRAISSITYNTLRGKFANVLIVPGSRNYYLASDGELGVDIGALIERRGIQTVYVNKYYLDDQALRERSNTIVAGLDSTASVNRDFSPGAYYRQVRYWLSYFHVSALYIAGGALVLLAALLMTTNAISFGMFAGGFAASSVEVLLLIAFQVVYGYVFRATGLIITVFMAGLAAGAFFAGKVSEARTMRTLIFVQIGIAVYCFLLPAMLFFARDFSGWDQTAFVLFLLLTFVLAVLVGMEFALAAALQRGSVSVVASSLYSVDLFGSALGALLVSAFLLPLFGITTVSLMLGLLTSVAAAVSYRNRTSYGVKRVEALSYV